ncbi:hypothetical protein GGR50DRAFT_393382 [Xylaria sp. CBS 124048]|nr:hypothetical protein GGR50DRAFT_393382 [Xylaria sp. CBS 124048]
MLLRRNTRLAPGANDQLLPKSTLNPSPNGRNPGLGPGRKVKVNTENGSVTLPRGSSVSTSFSLDNLRDVRSSSEAMKTSAGDSDTNDRTANQRDIPQENNGVDDQQSTEPVPSDLDRAVFRLSSSPETYANNPVTGSKARCQDLTIDEPKSAEHNAQLNVKIEDMRPKLYNNKYGLSPYDSATASVRGKAQPPCTDGSDGLSDGSRSAPSEDSTVLCPKTRGPKLSSDDDEYRLPESEIDTPEESIIAEIRGHSKKIANKISNTKATSLPRSTDKQPVKAKVAVVTAKRPSPQAASKSTAPTQKRSVAPDHSIHSPQGQGAPLDGLLPSNESVTGPMGGDDTPVPDSIPVSQNVEKKELGAGSPKAKSNSRQVRRAKKPFFQDNLSGERTETKPTVVSRSKKNLGQGKSNLLAIKKTKSRGQGSNSNRSRNKRVAPDISQSREERRGNKNDEKPTVGTNNGLTISHDQSISQMTTGVNDDILPITLSSDDNLELTETPYEKNHLKNPLYQAKDEASERSGNHELDERVGRGIELTDTTKGLIEKPINEFRVTSLAYPPRLCAGPAHSDKAKNEASQMEKSEVQSLSYHPLGQFNVKEGPSHITGRSPSNRPQASDIDSLPRADPVTRVMGEWRRPDKSDGLRSVGAPQDILSTENLLHPKSRKWAQEIAARSLRKNTIPISPITPEETAARTPIMTRESKDETALKARRKAVFECIQDLTTTVLRHLQSKENVTDDIARTYQRNGQRLINTLLDRQSIELCQTAAAFDDKCVKLRNLFEESARHADTVKSRVSSEHDGRFKDRERRSERLVEMVRKASETVASI